MHHKLYGQRKFILSHKKMNESREEINACVYSVCKRVRMYIQLNDHASVLVLTHLYTYALQCCSAHA